MDLLQPLKQNKNVRVGIYVADLSNYRDQFKGLRERLHVCDHTEMVFYGMADSEAEGGMMP